MNVDLLIKENKELSEEKQRYKEMWFFANDSLSKYRDLEEELGCPLEVVGRLLLHKERYIYTVEKSKLTGEDFMDKHTIVGISEFGVCILTTNCVLKTEPRYYKWNEYKNAWWLKEDKSE